MSDFFDRLEGWFTKPVTDDLSPALLIVLAVILTVAVVWTLDGLAIIMKPRG